MLAQVAKIRLFAEFGSLNPSFKLSPPRNIFYVKNLCLNEQKQRLLLVASPYYGKVFYTQTTSQRLVVSGINFCFQ
jgi:hypothetical protein